MLNVVECSWDCPFIFSKAKKLDIQQTLPGYVVWTIILTILNTVTLKNYQGQRCLGLKHKDKPEILKHGHVYYRANFLENLFKERNKQVTVEAEELHHNKSTKSCLTTKVSYCMWKRLRSRKIPSYMCMKFENNSFLHKPTKMGLIYHQAQLSSLNFKMQGRRKTQRQG